MDLTQIILAIITAFVSISGVYFGYMQIVVPAKEKNKQANHEKEIEKLKAEKEAYKSECNMWKEKAHASESEAKLEIEKRQNIEMTYRIEINEYKNALESIELFTEDENVLKVVGLLKSKLAVNITPAM
jgi:hypothetical protein